MEWRQLALRGKTVELRPLEVEDVEPLAAAAAESRDSYRFTPVPDGVADAHFYVERALEAMATGDRLALAIVWDRTAVGSSSFIGMQPWPWPAGSPRQRSGRPDAVEIGATWLASSAQRTRCNSEAKLLMLSHAFDVWEVYAVRFRTDERNERSRRSIEQLGAKLDGVLRADFSGPGERPRNSASYSIVASEWPLAREGLRARLRR